MRFTLILTASAVALAGCGGEPAERGASVADEPAATAAATGRPLEPADTRAVEIGGAAAAALTSELISNLAAAIEEGGAAHAIDFCSERALPLTADVAERLGVGLKRTSSRVRNPANAPDASERAALEHFEAARAEGAPLPADYLQRLAGETRYYRPIVVAELCTACHGEASTLDQEVRARLQTRYPDDQATGYRAGDFRGVLRVSIRD